MKAQTDPEGTARYIKRQMQYDMGNIAGFYDGQRGQMFVAVGKDNDIVRLLRLEN